MISRLNRAGRQQLVDLHAPVTQLPQTTTPPLQFWQHRRLVPLSWQYGGVHAYPRAEGSNSSSTELLNRPSDLRMSVPFCRPERSLSSRVDSPSYPEFT